MALLWTAGIERTIGELNRMGCSVMEELNSTISARVSDMLRITKNHAIGNALEDETDRGCAILAACVLEDELRDALRHRLGVCEKELENFVPSGQIGRGVDLAYFVGLICKSDRADWKLVISIRNRFAHSALTDLTFSDAAIAAKIDALANSQDVAVAPRLLEHTRLKFVFVVARLYSRLINQENKVKALERVPDWRE